MIEANKEKTATILDVEGMTCANCAIGVENQLKKLGAADIKVNFALGEASFIAPKSISADEIAKGITQIGYKSRIREYDKDEKSGMSSIEKKFWFSLIFTLPLITHMFLPHDSFMQNPILQVCLASPVFILGVFHFGKSGLSSLRTGAPNMDVLIFIGSASAFFYSSWGAYMFYGTPLTHDFLFFETSASIVSLVLLGNLLEHRSITKTTSAIKDLSAMQVKTAMRFNSNGEPEEITYNAIQVGDLLLVNTGDIIPVDGVIMEGNGTIDESMISGESIPLNKEKGNKVVGSTILTDGNIIIKAEAIGRNTVLSKIIDLVKNAQQDKPEIQRLGDRVSAIFVPIVLGISLTTFLISKFGFDLSTQQSMLQAIAVLVISCPCAMGLATPTAVMVGIGRAAKKGILIKGGSTLEELAKTKTIIFDKTGTLTTGKFSIKSLNVLEGEEQEIIDVLFNIEARSSHPIAKSIVENLKEKAKTISLSNIEEIKGIGLSATDESSNNWKVGSYRIASDLTDDKLHEVYILKNNKLVATLDIQDEIKPKAKEMIAELTRQGIEIILLSGDKQGKCDALAQALNIKTVFAEQLPEEKLAKVEEYSSKGNTVMVGDGVNDAPALARATVGISFGDATDVSINTAQVVLLGTNGIDKLAETLHLSRLTYKTIKQNLFWAFFYNVLAIPVAAFGFLSPIIATATMGLSDIVVIGNSILLKVKK
jgi:P-type Cu+ transporter